MSTPVINGDLCDGCEECVKICPADIFLLQAGKAVVEEADYCTGCRVCEVDCTRGAIYVHD